MLPWVESGCQLARIMTAKVTASHRQKPVTRTSFPQPLPELEQDRLDLINENAVLLPWQACKKTKKQVCFENVNVSSNASGLQRTDLP